MVSMMCPGISYSTVHSLIFHNNGSVQENKLYQEFCNRKQAHFAYGFTHPSITEASIDNETLTLKDQPLQEKYDDSWSAITLHYEVITTFMKINNISATWESFPWYNDQSNSSYQVAVTSFMCYEGVRLECCQPM